MRIHALRLINYRNYKELFLEFNPNLNILIGKNGQGKTNLVEAIYLLGFGKSFRTNKDKELVKFHEEHAYVCGRFTKQERSNEIELFFNNKNKKGAKINKISIDKVSDLIGRFNIVVFSPEDLKLVKDGPKERRKFIDKEISQILPKYYYLITTYNKILMQRNNLLKMRNVDLNLLDIYDEQLATSGSAIYLYRRDFIKKLAQIARDMHKKLTDGTEDFKISYSNQLKVCEGDREEDVNQRFKSKLSEDRKFDIERGNTKTGPHKDDLEVFINGIDVRTYGSQGQQRTSSISLKLSEIQLIKEEIGENPVLILDDVFSELDEKRQGLLIENLKDVQIFVTSAERSHERIFSKMDHSIYYVNSGKVSNQFT